MKIPTVDKRGHLKTILIVSTISVLVSIYGWVQVKNDSDTDARFETVLAYTIDENSVIRAYGQVIPKETSTIITEVAGKVTQTFVKPGSIVSSGDVFLQLHNREIERKLEQAEISFLKSQARHASTIQTIQQERLSNAHEVKLAQSQLLLKQTEVKAKAKLYDANIISSFEYDRARVEEQRAKLAVEIATEKQTLNETISISQLDISALELESVKKEMEYSKLANTHLEVSTPTSGIVIKVNDALDVGSNIEASSFVAQIANTDAMYVQLSTNANDAGLLEIGQNVKVTIKQQDFWAQISRIAPYVRENQVEFDSEFIEDIPSNTIPYTNIVADVLVERQSLGVAIPNLAFLTEEHQRYEVYVMDDDKKNFRLTSVHVGSIQNDHIFIKSGLQSGDTVLAHSPSNFDSIAILSVEDIQG